jgi:hypothetical protein
MNTFEIEIQETLTRVVKVNANELDEALQSVKERYNMADIVLDYNDFSQVQLIDINSESLDVERRRLTKELINYLMEPERNHFEELRNHPNSLIYKSLIRLMELTD